MKVQLYYSPAVADAGTEFMVNLQYLPRQGDRLNISRDMLPHQYFEAPLKELFATELNAHGSITVVVDFVAHDIEPSGHRLTVAFCREEDR